MKTQNSHKIHILIVFFALIVAFNSCNRKTHTTKKEAVFLLKEKEIAKLLNQNPYPFNHFAAKVKVNATYRDKKYSFTNQLRWHYNNKIWMSFSIFGIEGYRLLIEPDSFKMMNRLKKEYMVEPISYFQELSGVDISFFELQDVLLGKMPSSINKKTIIQKLENGIQIENNIEAFLNLAVLNNLDGSIAYQLLESNSSNRRMKVEQSEYVTDEVGIFSRQRNMVINDGKYITKVEMDFNKVKTSNSQEYPFEIPEKYNAAK